MKLKINTVWKFVALLYLLLFASIALIAALNEISHHLLVQALQQSIGMLGGMLLLASPFIIYGIWVKEKQERDGIENIKLIKRAGLIGVGLPMLLNFIFLIGVSELAALIVFWPIFMPLTMMYAYRVLKDIYLGE